MHSVVLCEEGQLTPDRDLFSVCQDAPGSGWYEGFDIGTAQPAYLQSEPSVATSPSSGKL
jgi:opacity protein-like surface antigen